jgi:uncharacterized membrane protein YbhN (UPF0104 family)
MSRVRVALSIGGVALLAWLVWRFGPSVIVESLTRITWWQLGLVALAHGAALTLDTLGWRYAFPRNRVPFRTLLSARTAGEAVNLVSALASVGGEAVKAWLIRDDVSYQESVPSVIVAKTASVVAQALFLLAGIAVAWTLLDWRSRVMTGMLWLLAIEVVAVGGFLATQVSGLIARAGRLVRAVGLIGADDSVSQLDADLRSYYRTHWRRFLVSVGWHVAGCVMAVVETWLILWAIGASTSAAVAVVVDSLGSGIRFATFLVPASLGALESGNAAAFAALGLGASVGLVFSLVRRARQVIWIGIGLVLLAVMRGRSRTRRERSEAPAA